MQQVLFLLCSEVVGALQQDGDTLVLTVTCTSMHLFNKMAAVRMQEHWSGSRVGMEKMISGWASSDPGMQVGVWCLLPSRANRILCSPLSPFRYLSQASPAFSIWCWVPQYLLTPGWLPALSLFSLLAAGLGSLALVHTPSPSHRAADC